MKRALLIAGGTVGGLGAVLAITPPQFTSTQDVSGLSGSLGGGTGAVQTTPAASTPAATKSAAAPVATKTATKKATTKASASATAAASQSASSTPVASATPTPTATHTSAAPATGGYSGTVTGASFNARNYGTLSATVTFSNGKITNVRASQSPRSWSRIHFRRCYLLLTAGKLLSSR